MFYFPVLTGPVAVLEMRAARCGHETRPLRFWLLAGYRMSLQTFKLVSGSIRVAFSRDLSLCSFDGGQVSTDACFTGVATSLYKLTPQ